MKKSIRNSALAFFLIFSVIFIRYVRDAADRRAVCVWSQKEENKPYANITLEDFARSRYENRQS